ncbi:monovalent cation/H(+) antiporter subunit G [Natrialba taiwanensis]|uniref:Monovalent cation/proton antiporter, MnhG/PhaG subunit n=1 Tax=Natrialba taiwanensis DSM 12281 TaxID=1230458 RepID=L9ZJ53_9EURY|nr:monovalent cation/H(+) antiporter subunit G [Natrialba taiwanensis]ELY85617.1 monovalent cation/proton antiporter, MnhG/PhaG subunit [Natrialba taiwanensis DSM 12281]
MIDQLQFWAVLLCLAFGLFFTFVSTVGVLRLPDVYSRAHTASQTDTLGAGLSLAAVALALGWESTTIYTVLLLFFVFLTNPTAAHAIARSAAESGITPLTAEDELESETPDDGASAPGDTAVNAGEEGGDHA